MKTQFITNQKNTKYSFIMIPNNLKPSSLKLKMKNNKTQRQPAKNDTNYPIRTTKTPVANQ